MRTEENKGIAASKQAYWIASLVVATLWVHVSILRSGLALGRFVQQEHGVSTCAKMTDESRQYASMILASDVKAEQQSAFNSVPPFTSFLPSSFVKHPLNTTWPMSELKSSDQTRMNRVLYFITPTYERITQMVDMTKLAQTMQLAAHVSKTKIYWIVIEDARNCSNRIRQLLLQSEVSFAHLAAPTPTSQERDGDVFKFRGKVQRHAGLEVVRRVGAEGVIYFGDDDNTFSTQLFSELMYTASTSVLAVGFSGGGQYERCYVSNTTGKVSGFHILWRGHEGMPRKYPIDMAGFAFSTSVLVSKNPRFHTSTPQSYMETDFVEQLVSNASELQPLGGNCTKILVWHTQTRTDGTNPVSRTPVESEDEWRLVASLA
jgi:galactosylgalactosylxylosylprotein 3-beta-glucuronosyltransferase 3